jgi:cytochrome c556
MGVVGLMLPLLAAAGGTIACMPKGDEVTAADGRTPIVVPAEVRDKILGEMRTMLGSLNAVLAGLSRGDTAAIRQAAVTAGMAMAVDPALERYLPKNFLQQGMRTHLQFDSLAAAIGAGAGPDSVIARLANLTANCVSCHTTYRITTR